MKNAKARPTVLVVEDEFLILMLAVGIFTDAGFDVLEAVNSEEALETLTARSDIDALFTDVEMPGPIDGFQLAKAAIASHPKLKVMIVSGRHTPANGNVPRGALFVVKPYDGARVLADMTTMLAA